VSLDIFFIKNKPLFLPAKGIPNTCSRFSPTFLDNIFGYMYFFIFSTQDVKTVVAFLLNISTQA
jgi:hypothetical protein